MTAGTDSPETVYEGKFLRIKKRPYAGGHWEYVERANAAGAVVIIALTADDELILVEQPRLPVQSQVIELPAGLYGDIDPDEPPVEAALRELEEETGYRAASMVHLLDGPPSPGLANEGMCFFLARDVVRIGAGGGVDHEEITTHVIPLHSVHEWLFARMRDGVMVDPKVFAGLYFSTIQPT